MPERAICTSVGQRPTVNDIIGKVLKGRNVNPFALSGIRVNLSRNILNIMALFVFNFLFFYYYN